MKGTDNNLSLRVLEEAYRVAQQRILRINLFHRLRPFPNRIWIGQTDFWLTAEEETLFSSVTHRSCKLVYAQALLGLPHPCLLFLKICVFCPMKQTLE